MMDTEFELEMEPEAKEEYAPSPESNSDMQVESEEKFLQAIFDINEIIDLLKENKVDSLESIKGCLLNIDVLLNYFQKEYSSLESFSKLKVYLSKEEEKISDLINRDASSDEVIQELESLLKEVEKYYRLVTDKKPNVITPSEDPQIESRDPNVFVEPLDLPQINVLYEKLYEAIEKNDSKKETLYRGRIIRQLEKYEDLINEKYEKISVLEDIFEIIQEQKAEMLHDVKEVLFEPQNKEFFDYFEDTLHSETLFLQKYYELCQRPDIRTILFYHSSLKEELKMQGKKLDERYEREFLDKKAGVTSVATTLPKAVGLSIQKLANTIREAKEAKTKRKKVAKVLESIKAAGKVLVTPAVYLGKFAINNWYALYKVYQGYENAKVMIEEEKQARAEKETRAADAKSKATEEKQAIDEARAKAAKDAQDKAAESRKKMEEARLEEETEAKATEGTVITVEETKPEIEPEVEPEVEMDPEIQDQQLVEGVTVPQGILASPEIVTQPVSQPQAQGQPQSEPKIDPDVDVVPRCVTEPRPCPAPQAEAAQKSDPGQEQPSSIPSVPSETLPEESKDFVIRVPVVPMVVNPKVNAQHDPDGTADGIYWNEVRPSEIIQDMKKIFGGNEGKGSIVDEKGFSGHGGKF